MSQEALFGWLSPEEIVLHRMKSFHRERVEAVVGNRTPLRLKDESRLVVHLIPLESVRSPRSFPAANLKKHGQQIAPLGERPSYSRFNADGFLTYDGRDQVRAYSQLYRDGRLEAVMTDTAYPQNGGKALRDGICERALFEAVAGYISFCKGISIDQPLWLFTALAGCEGVRIGNWHYGLSETAIDRPIAYLPELEIASFDIDPVTVLRPLCDALWNAVGFERSFNYDEAGNRRERR